MIRLFISIVQFFTGTCRRVVLPSILLSIEYFNFNWAFQYSRLNTLETRARKFKFNA